MWLRWFVLFPALALTSCSSSSSSSDEKRQCDAVSAPASCECILSADDPPKKPVPVCDEALLGGPALCCQGATGCSCARVGCQGAAGSCACSAASSQSNECTGAICCNWVKGTTGTCSCGANACPSDTVQVSACNAAALACPPSQTRVDKCEPQ